jgi:hypothetical protein
MRNTNSPTVKPANAASGLVAAVIRSVKLTGCPATGWMCPMFPATLTTSPTSAVTHGHTRCRTGQPSRYATYSANSPTARNTSISAGHDIACQPASR